MSTDEELADCEPGFRARLAALLEDSPHHIGITSAWRSRAEQQRLYDGWKARRPGFHPANRPGSSKHERTVRGEPAAEAADLSYSSAAARTWAHQHAERYGLHFPIPREPWHVESNGRSIDLEDDVPLSDDDVQRVAKAVHALTKKDAVTILRAADQPSIKTLDTRLARIEAALGAGK